MASIVAYHGVTASDHQTRFDQLAPQGFRPLSLNVSGDPGDARYAAVWIQRPGVDWVAMHGVDAATYQARFDELVAHGLSPSIVSATGPAASASFTALFERIPRRWFARHNLRWGPDTDPDTITHENGRASNEGYLPLCLSVYGDPSDLRYAGIWVGNERATPWSWWSISGDAYQRFFDALVRPAPARSGWRRPRTARTSPPTATRRSASGPPATVSTATSTRPSSTRRSRRGCGPWSSRRAAAGLAPATRRSSSATTRPWPSGGP